MMDPFREISYEWFKVVYLFTQFIGILLICLMGYWLKYHMGGFAWRSDPKKEFNWHPLLITISMIVLHGHSVLTYRGFRQIRKITLKITHTILLTTELILIGLALIAVFDSHNLADPPIPNLYSLHSWIGIGNVTLFIFQWVVGIVTLLLPILSINIKEAVIPYHRFIGLLILINAIATGLMGLTEKALWAIPDYKEYSKPGIIVNCLGVLMVFYGSLVYYLLSQPEYKRLSVPEDEVQLKIN